jgi:hypothetical protein
VHSLNQGWIRIEVWKALAQVNGLMLQSQLAHGGKDGGAHRRELGCDLHGSTDMNNKNAPALQI